ncbi:NfeD family protein [Argonema galeatum]|uniref:NfeD family protein n=1 Tax=Argonema galeatum TaxID=2942762 RepID=UPI002012C48D|nr:NfeD family protein [Argonema galeatum A003/A1]
MLLSPTLIWSVIGPSVFWFLTGVILCLTELFLGKSLGTKLKLVPLIAGVSSLIVGLLLLGRNSLPLFRFQVMYWMAVSLASVIWLRPMFLKRKKFIVRDATEAKTITEILAGQTGRVIYEGCFWQACCEDRSIAIAPNQKVYVLRREGNTLIVAPESIFHS